MFELVIELGALHAVLVQTGSKKGRQLSAQAIEVVKQYFSFRSTINVPGQAAQTDCHTAVFKFGTHKGEYTCYSSRTMLAATLLMTAESMGSKRLS